MVATPLSVAVSPERFASVTRPVTYIALVVKSALSVPVVVRGARARHSKAPVTPPPAAAAAWNATVVNTGTNPPALPVPPSIIVVPPPRAIIRTDDSEPVTDRGNAVTTIRTTRTAAPKAIAVRDLPVRHLNIPTSS